MSSRRGNIYRLDWLGSTHALVQVLGGPFKLGQESRPQFNMSLYTVRVLEGMVHNSRKFEVGETTLIPEPILLQGHYIGLFQIDQYYAHQNVVTGWCPECEEDEMIFYGEDYICAWCREHLEDA